MQVSAIVTAGDRRASKAIHAESKVYLEIDSRPLVAHVVCALQWVPEVSEVWVVGDASRLAAVFACPDVRAEIRKPLQLVAQRRNLYENGWETYRRLLPGAGPEGRDPGPDDLDRPVLYLSADLPFATPQEISAFVRRALALRCDYALGVVSEQAIEPFYAAADGMGGIRMAYFNLAEGRIRQSNLHLIRPARIGNRHYVEEMYEHRHQREFGSVVRLAWRLLRGERGLVVLYYFALMHLAGVFDRSGWQRLADRVRRLIPIASIERGCSRLLAASFRFVATEAGGCAVDVDTEHDYEVCKARYAEWSKGQAERAEQLYGPLLPAPSAPGAVETREREP